MGNEWRANGPFAQNWNVGAFQPKDYSSLPWEFLLTLRGLKNL
jgi:hypothetical protein